jgi:hypothetical protein
VAKLDNEFNQKQLAAEQKATGMSCKFTSLFYSLAFLYPPPLAEYRSLHYDLNELNRFRRIRASPY